MCYVAVDSHNYQLPEHQALEQSLTAAFFIYSLISLLDLQTNMFVTSVQLFSIYQRIIHTSQNPEFYIKKIIHTLCKLCVP